ncbi:MAG: DUF342 domain-containing protein [Candidatus Sericytochromatia bacterium]|nr:DUF342 domain-containing protein [Candidatus Tanganyikabacteria bacterium]
MGEDADSGLLHTYTVEVARDRMSARVAVSVEGRRPTYLELSAALERAGVVYGVDDVIVHRIAAGIEPGEYVVAKGEPPVAPIDGRVDFFFRTGPRVLMPNLLADGRVDHHDLGAFELVEEGQLLARRTPPVSGQPGMTVTGEEIPAKTPRDVSLKGGRGTQVSLDGLLVFAAIKGQPVFSRGLIVVNPNLRIEGDIDYGTGDVGFDGNVEILGEVKRQFTVRATGNIYVHGAVDGGVLQAGGSIVVEGGCRAGAVLTAGSDVRARYIEYSRVTCDGHLIVRDDLMFTQVECGGTVQVEGGLVGGYLEADISVRAESLGSRLGTPTEICLRPRAKWAAKMREAEETAEEMRAHIAEIEAAVGEARGRQRTDFDGVMTKLAMALDKFRAELATATARQLMARKRFEALGHPKVFVTTVIHPGVRIFLNEAVAKFESDQLCTTCYEEGGRVHVA